MRSSLRFKLPASPSLHCPTCGKQLPARAYFCAYCGALIRAAPAPFPPLAFNLRAAVLALAGTAAALPVCAGFWLLVASLANIPSSQALALGLAVAALAGCSAAVLAPQLRWPLDAQPPRCSPRQLAVLYGVAGGLAVALGAPLIGSVVQPAGLGSGLLDVPTVLAGATSGFIGSAFAVPPALLVGALAGEVLGRLAGHLPAPAAPWAAALAWWLAGSSGGAVVAVFVALQANLAPSTSVVLGALLQSGLQVLLFPFAAYLVRLIFLLVS